MTSFARFARIGGLLAAIAFLCDAATAAASALGKVRKGETVEVSGTWDFSAGVFQASKIEPIDDRRDPSARGAIDVVNGGARSFSLFGREVIVDEATVFAADSGTTGHFGALGRGMRVEVSAEAQPSGTWKAKKVELSGVKSSDKIKGRITHVGPLEESAQRIQIYGLDILVTEATDLKTDYLEEELLGTLVSDEGDVGAPIAQLGPLRAGGYARVTTFRDAGQAFPGAIGDSVVGQPALGLQVVGEWARSFRTLVDVRMGSTQSWVGRRVDLRANNTLEVLQAYAILSVGKDKGAMLMVGKQRLRDAREWLFDEYLDAARLYVTLTRPVIFEASYIPSLFAAEGEKFETWDDLLIRTRYIPDSRSEVSAYWLKRWDSSTRHRQPVYLGLSATGRPTRWMRGWLEGTLLRGEDKGRAQRAHAVDLGMMFSTTGRVRPSLTVAYALGSGEIKVSGDPYSQEFRQTGYEDNSARFGGLSRFKYYGEVLDPELSNLEVITAGVGVRIGYWASVDAVARVYNQQWPDDEVRSNLLLQGTPDGHSRDLGKEGDLILGVQPVRMLSASYAFGVFDPGEALKDEQRATRHRLSVRFNF